MTAPVTSPEQSEVGCDDFCRACRGNGSVGGEKCWRCSGLGHSVASRTDVRWPRKAVSA